LAEQAGLESNDLDKVVPESGARAHRWSAAHAYGVLPLRVEGDASSRSPIH
jgi:hypothetical protein